MILLILLPHPEDTLSEAGTEPINFWSLLPPLDLGWKRCEGNSRRARLAVWCSSCRTKHRNSEPTDARRSPKSASRVSKNASRPLQKWHVTGVFS
jgi:hypothetical protein